MDDWQKSALLPVVPVHLQNAWAWRKAYLSALHKKIVVKSTKGYVVPFYFFLPFSFPLSKGISGDAPVVQYLDMHPFFRISENESMHSTSNNMFRIRSWPQNWQKNKPLFLFGSICITCPFHKHTWSIQQRPLFVAPFNFRFSFFSNFFNFIFPWSPESYFSFGVTSLRKS